ncbi:MAG: IS1634 family transposase [Salinivirgaceae bacterium]|jgi:transposase|nr:IS1634 family transposase [Salinivirgaceae bacterium]
MLLSVGRLEELPDIRQKEAFIDRINQLATGSPKLFKENIEPVVERLAQHFYNELRLKNKIDFKPKKNSNYEIVKLNTLKNKDVREFGAESICYQAFEQLKIGKYLRARKWSDEDINLATTHIISRAIYPASEYKTVSWIKENSSVCEISGCDRKKITKDKLYSIAHKLFREKDGLESFLSRCTNELFNLEDTVILYDLTNTYFEGSMIESKLGKFGRSKEKRSDAKLIVLALVVNREGFLKYSDIFEGNTTDSSTLKHIVKKLNEKSGYGSQKPTIVMDAGIATEDNITFLKQQGHDYLCVARSGLKQYKADSSKKPVEIKDKKASPIEVLRVRSQRNDDAYFWVKSYTKALKEKGMSSKFAQGFEEGLRSIQNGISSKGGTKKLDKVWERIGRLKQKYPSTHQYYEITVKDNGKGITTELTYQEKTDVKADQKAGIYFLRTSLDIKDEKTIWTIYNAIREIEYTFRVLKTELDLRPIYHKTDQAAMAHLHLGLLAYWLVSTIRYQLKMKEINHDWREIVRIMNTQKVVTTTVESKQGATINIRQCSEPDEKTTIIYQKLKYNPIYLPRKKSVWHTVDNQKKLKANSQPLADP